MCDRRYQLEELSKTDLDTFFCNIDSLLGELDKTERLNVPVTSDVAILTLSETDAIRLSSTFTVGK